MERRSVDPAIHTLIQIYWAWAFILRVDTVQLRRSWRRLLVDLAPSVTVTLVHQIRYNQPGVDRRSIVG
jgi:hypothetical protein